MSMTRQEAAQALGMKVREVTAVDSVDNGGHIVTTHDGQRTLITASGERVAAGDLLVAGKTTTPQPDDDGDPAGKPARTPRRPSRGGKGKTDPPPAPDGADGQMPDGPADAIMAWVGDDQERAAAALAAHRDAAGRDGDEWAGFDTALQELAG
jgi:hypothetical protein